MTFERKLDSYEFWQYSIQVYQHDMVKMQSLYLQDHFFANVNLLLLCMFLDRQGLVLKRAQLERIIDDTTEIQDRLIIHREVRKGLKAQPIEYMHDTLSEYQRALDEEKELEKEQQAIMVNTFNKHICHQVSFTDDVSSHLNLFTYAEIIGRNFDVDNAINILCEYV